MRCSAMFVSSFGRLSSHFDRLRLEILSRSVGWGKPFFFFFFAHVRIRGFNVNS